MQLVADKKAAKKTVSQLIRTRKALAEYKARFEDFILDITAPESRLSRLEDEKELLGAYVSAIHSTSTCKPPERNAAQRLRI